MDEKTEKALATLEEWLIWSEPIRDPEHRWSAALALLREELERLEQDFEYKNEQLGAALLRAEKAEAELKQKQKDYDWMIAQHDVWRLCSFEESKRKKKSEAEAERLRDTCQDALTQFSDFFDAARVTAGNDDLDGRPLNDIEKKLRAALACRTDDDAPKARQLRTSAEVKGLREEWFNKGRESVLRKNQSGCCCLFDENDNIVSLCDAHRAWAEAELARWKPLIEAAEELLEVAALRGDADLPHPADDPKLWTARMQTAWDELRAAALAYREAKEKP